MNGSKNTSAWREASRKVGVVDSILDRHRQRELHANALAEGHDPEFFVKNAARCFRLVPLAPDWRVAEDLNRIGREFANRAIELGADPGNIPVPE